MSDVELFTPSDGMPVRSYAEANRELVTSFVRYMESRGLSPRTIESYGDSCARFAETLGSASVVEADRSQIRFFLTGLLKKGLHDNSVRLHTAALRCFWKFIGLSGITNHNPTLILSHRKVPGRLPRVLSGSEVERLIAAAQDPFERAVVEMLYGTGVRVSELVGLRLENIDFAEHRILVKKGKGGKDRYVLFGSPAAKAIFEYRAWRPTKTFLFEAPARNGHIIRGKRWWTGLLYVNRIQHRFKIGQLPELPTAEDARRQFDRIAANIPGFKPVPARPYSPGAIRGVLNRLAHRAGVGHIHPHSLRRAMACHMLSGGGNLRAIQELLGHERIGTTQLYTHLTAQELKKTHQKCHPHEQRRTDEKK
jgi:integrase/recombinase XerC